MICVDKHNMRSGRTWVSARRGRVAQGGFDKLEGADLKALIEIGAGGVDFPGNVLLVLVADVAPNDRTLIKQKDVKKTRKHEVNYPS
jgi:hypothetical protein